MGYTAQGCQECFLHKNGNVIVDGYGPTPADVMIIGQCPGKQEVVEKTPFVGRSGQLLSALLDQVGLNRKEIYITNAVKCFVPPGKTVHKKALEKCVAIHLFDEIKLVSPKIILVLGAVAARAFREKTVTGTKYFDTDLNAWLVFSHHPARIIRTSSKEFEADLLRDIGEVARLCSTNFFEGGDEATLDEPDVTIISTREQLEQYSQEIISIKKFGVDLETTGLNFCKDRILSAGISDGTKCYGFVWNEETKSFIQDFLENQETKIVGHNLKYDLKMTYQVGVYPTNVVADTMLLHHVLYPNSGSNKLKDISMWLFGTSFSKEELDFEELFSREVTPEDLEMLAKRAALDAYLTIKVYERLTPRLADKELTQFHDAVLTPTMLLLTEMEFNGVLIDLKELERLEIYLEYQIKTMRELVAQNDLVKRAVTEMKEDTFNLNSPKQVAYLLFNVMKIPIPKGYKRSTDQETLEKILVSENKGVDPRLIEVVRMLVGQVIEYRGLVKLKKTYCKNLREALERGKENSSRIHPEYYQDVAATGRLSCRKPNLQNIPKRSTKASEIRKLFIAPNGKSLLESDYDQIEFRCWAHMSKDARLIETIQEGKDIHKYIASLVFGKREEDVTEKERDLAKSVVYGLMYGRGTKAIGLEFDIDFAGACRVKDLFFSEFPVASDWLAKATAFGLKNNWVKHSLGRRMPILYDNSNRESVAQAGRRAANYPIQGFASDINNITGAHISKQIRDLSLDARPVMNIHDSLIFEVAEDQVELLVNVIGTSVQEIKKRIDFRVRLDMKCKVGKTLATTKLFVI